MAADPRSVFRPAQTELCNLLDGIASSVLWLDGDAAVVHLNEPAEDLFGVSRNQAAGRSLRDLLKGNVELAGVIDRSRATGAQYSRRELPFEAGPGAPLRMLDVTVTPFDQPGRPGGVVVELADVTQHQRILRENALLTQLGGSRAMVRQLAHEIKNPLGGLRGAAQLLERQLKDPALHEYTTVIISEADRLAALVDALLGPGQPPRKEPVNVHEVVQHVGHLLAAEAPNGVAIERDYDPSLPRLRLDRNQVIQALLNLGRNAIQSVGERGRVVLRTRALTNASIGSRRHRVVACIQVEDDGPGVPADLKDTVFYPLVTGRPGGTGLGLAVAQDLVGRHDGLIEFESRPGRTVFTILLPYDSNELGEST
ncbi:MAG TPA: nitrogen regulation protein NR(II) [Steroidobacteraceae bacterium]|nr:nitrogen regulation protein NR(II) [Steroidobacteraceae bacterium]